MEYTRVNFQIKSPTVRVIDDGKQLGVFLIDKARELAQQKGLDLVEIVPHAKPPVCSIIDFNKYKFEQKVKEKELRKKQRETLVQIKKLRLRPVSEEHDVLVKVNHARKFLAEAKKVEFTVEFRNSELAHKEKGFTLIKEIISHLEDVSVVELSPKLEGKKLFCRLAPKV